MLDFLDITFWAFEIQKLRRPQANCMYVGGVLALTTAKRDLRPGIEARVVSTTTAGAIYLGNNTHVGIRVLKGVVATLFYVRH